MKTILVSIISDQTIPNLLIIKELAGRYNRQIFISTKKMEEAGKSFWIEKAAGIGPGTIQRIVVDENNWSDIQEKLTIFNWPENSEYIVNLTGGTKVITLAVYEYFARPGNRIIYAPIGRNAFEELYPTKAMNTVAFNARLNVSEYLTAHGVRFFCKQSAKKSYNELKTIFKSFKNKGYDINSLNEGYPPEWKNYFTGEWFEEYLCFRITNELGLLDGFILMGVELMHFDEVKTSGNDQELDIVFVFDNELYLIEAKVSLGKPPVKTDAIHRVMFKLSAINKNFGLRSHASLITMADTDGRSENFRRDLQRKMKVLGIKNLIDRNRISETGFSFRELVI
jgi:hypothetical protein